MKKHLLLFAFSALALTSCEDDDVQGYELDMLKGEWKTVKTEVISGADNKTVINTMIPSGCETKKHCGIQNRLLSFLQCFYRSGCKLQQYKN